MTIAPVTKPPPFTVRVKVGPPAVALAGDNVLVFGSGLSMGRVSGADSPPLTSGSKTVTVRLPAAAISLASIGVLNWLESINVVVLSTEFIRITKPSIKPVPLTTKSKPAPPATALEGERLVMVGAASVRWEAVSTPGLEE